MTILTCCSEPRSSRDTKPTSEEQSQCQNLVQYPARQIFLFTEDLSHRKNYLCLLQIHKPRNVVALKAEEERKAKMSAFATVCTLVSKRNIFLGSSFLAQTARQKMCSRDSRSQSAVLCRAQFPAHPEVIRRDTSTWFRRFRRHLFRFRCAHPTSITR